MNRAKLSEVNFGIKRLMEDLGKIMIINYIAAGEDFQIGNHSQILVTPPYLGTTAMILEGENGNL